MRIFLYANDKQRFEHIRKKSLQFFNSSGSVVQFDFQDPGDNFLVIDNDDVNNFAGVSLNNISNVYLYDENQFFSVSEDQKKLITLRTQYIKDELWDAARNINDVLLNTDFLLKRTKPAGFPDYLQIETTNKCNAECIMCSHYYIKNRSSIYLSNTIIEKLSHILPYARVIAINGGGEPFINPYISSQIEEFVRFGAKITTKTNLSVINDNLISQINSYFINIQLSCDAASKTTYEQIRNNLSFDIFVNNLKLLQERCPDIDRFFASVIMRQNITELPDIVRFAGQSGIKLISFINLNPDIIIDNNHDNMLNYPNVLSYYLDKAKETGRHLGIKIIAPAYKNSSLTHYFNYEMELITSLPMFKSKSEIIKMLNFGKILIPLMSNNNSPAEEPKKSSIKCTGICDWLLRRAYINSRGDVNACCINQTFQCGNVEKSGSFEDVWQSDYYQKIRGIFYSGYLPEYCLGCGLIEGGSFKYLKIDITQDFYYEPEYMKMRRQNILNLIKNQTN